MWDATLWGLALRRVVTITGLLAHYASVETAMSVFHTASGISVFLIAAAMLFGVSHLLRLSGVPE